MSLTLKKDDVSKANVLCAGDGVTCEGFVQGRRWEKDGKVRFFIDLEVKSLMVTDKAAKPTTATNWKELLALGAAYGKDQAALVEMCKALCKPFKAMQTEDWQNLAASIVASHPDAAETEDATDDDDMPF